MVVLKDFDPLPRPSLCLPEQVRMLISEAVLFGGGGGELNLLKGGLLKGSFDKRVNIDLPVRLPVPTTLPPSPPLPPFPNFHRKTTPHQSPEPDPKPLPQGHHQELTPLCENYPGKKKNTL